MTHLPVQLLVDNVQLIGYLFYFLLFAISPLVHILNVYLFIYFVRVRFSAPRSGRSRMMGGNARTCQSHYDEASFDSFFLPAGSVCLGIVFPRKISHRRCIFL